MADSFLHDDDFFPANLDDTDDIVAIGGDLSSERLLHAYGRGIFPWYSAGEPIFWFSPEERMLLHLDEFHLSGSMRRLCRQRHFSVKMDSCFPEVIRSCAYTPRKHESGTWILPEMIEAYCRLHELGFAHSVECYQKGQLVGGLYGINLGKTFFGESMFSLVNNASKFAMACLVAQCRLWEFTFIDCQVYNPHLETLGARVVGRQRFLQMLEDALTVPEKRGKWKADEEALLEEILRID
ncbi:MAG: leucyl/phenylalanyl-tRNA--protein transferase [Candidatus Hydrogenedens sp.]|nr:leucyl/phenylalanyl-tRNA--protein transferase [Candidatus Hydrogenedens sp.]